MLAEASKRDPEFVQRVLNLIESGLSSDELISTIHSDNIDKNEKKQEEHFSDEIRLISQAFSFRKPNNDDKMMIYKLICDGYHDEISHVHEESFRDGQIISFELFDDMFQENSCYQWIIMECPCGKDVLEDGSIIGVCCFSTDGLSRKNGDTKML